MIDKVNPSALRAEHESLPAYLRSTLTSSQLERPLIVSFSQWEMNTSVVAEIAANLHSMGADPTIALWADQTPLHDVGWTTSHALARLLMSPARDQRVAKALRRFGLPRSSFADPPLHNWRPGAEIPKITGLNRSAIRDLEYRRASVGRAILQVHPDDQTPVTDDHLWPVRWVEASLNSYAYAYDQVLELIRQRKASALVVFNGRFLHDAAAVAAAEGYDIPVLSFDFGGIDTDFDLTIDATHDWSALQTRMKHLYDSWDPRERDELGSRWFEDRRLHTDGRNARFVESQIVGRGIELPKDKRIVVFFSSSGDEISELDVDWGDYFYGQAGALSALANLCRDRDDLYLVVRTHPHKRMKPRRDVEEWLQNVAHAEPDLHVDQWSDVDSYTLMHQADVVVTFGSTTGVEAAYVRKPVVVTGPSAYDELGCATRVLHEEGLREAVANTEPGRWQGAIAYGLMMRRRGFKNVFLQRDASGVKRLQGVPLRDSGRGILKICDHYNKAKRRRLSGGRINVV